MANTYVDYTATAAQTDFNFSFPYLEDTHVEVSVDGISKTLTTDYTIETTPLRIVLVTPATSGVVVRIQRNSGPTIDLVDFVNGSVLTESALDRAYLHNRYLNEESFDGNDSSLRQISGGTDFNAASRRIRNVATPVDFTDAVNKNYIDEKLILGGTSLSGFSVSTHTGNGSLTEFTLSFTPQTSTASAFRVTVDGLVKTPTVDYTIGTTQITFTVAPLDTTSIVVVPLGTAQDVNSVGITATGSTTARSLSNRFSSVVNVLDYGAKGDAITDDTSALIAASAALTSGQTLYFPTGTYLISRSGFSDFTNAFGNVVCDLSNVDNISVRGENATLRLRNHNITADGGLRVFNFSNCNGIDFKGFHFDLTYTGYKNSSAFYPYCGAITFVDALDGQFQDPEDLNENIYISNCTFKIFHPLGCFGTTDNPYLLDPNNGWKLFTVWVAGPRLAEQPNNQARNVTIRDCIIKKGHNGYGFWVWSTANAVFDNLVAEDFVNKKTNVANESIVQNFSGIPFIRHHQGYTVGTKITNCFFRAKPSSERTTAGFEGASSFIHYTTQSPLDGFDLGVGESITSNNVIILGLGDLANSCYDTGIYIDDYGSHVISNNIFDGKDGDSTNINPSDSNGNLLQSCKAIDITPISRAGEGVLTVSVNNNIFGRWLKSDNITVYNGSDVGEYNRRLKELKVINNISLSQAAYFLRIEAPGIATPYVGLRSLDVIGNLIDGGNSFYDNTSTNSFGILTQGNQTGDVFNIKDNVFKNKYWGIRDLTSTNVELKTLNNSFYSVTNHFQDVASGSNLIESLGVNEQGTHESKVIGVFGGTLKAQEYSSGENISLYAQSVNQYLIASKRLNIYAQGAAQVVLDSGILRPHADGGVNLGAASQKWGQIYSTVGAISTSDERQKDDIGQLSDQELLVASELKGLIRKFKFKKSKETKGDKARIHVGVVAQDVKAVFEKHGLDGFDYGVLCYDEWEGSVDTDKDGNEITVEAGNAYGVRYSELFAFIISAL